MLIGEADTKFNELTNNYVGVDASGVVALGNGETGILLANGTQANSIGSRDEGARNIISGNAQAGIGISGANTSHHTVEGNYIGTNASGTAALPTGQGVAVGGGAQYNSIGSPGEARNIISGNTEQGVAIHGSTTCSNEIIANYIGTAANGVDDLGNGAHGVLIEEDAPRWNIVGVNVIAYNSTPGSQDGGVAVSQGAKYNAISQNSIFSNSGNGINLGPPGNRGNEDKAYPSITYAYINSGTVYVVGTAEPLNDVEIFHGYDCQGRTYEARTFTDPQGDWSWSSGSSGFSSGDLITTTATNIEANTSEFTPCVAVSASVPATTTTTTTSTTVAEGTTSTTAAGGTTSTTAAEGTTTTTTLAPVTEVVETSPTWNENQKAIEISYRTSQTGQLEFLVLNSQGTLVGRTAPQTISMSAAASWQSIAVNLDPKPSRGVYLLIAKINGTPVGKSHIIIK